MPVRVVAAIVGALLALTGCASTPTASAPALSNPAPRTPVLAACPERAEPSALPPVTLGCLTKGPRVDVSRLGGRPVLLNLWASWCAPCQRETPLLVRAQARERGVVFVGVDTMDEANSARDFLAAFGVHYPQLQDSSGALLHRLGAAGLPVTVVLDATGKVVFTRHGELRPADLASALGTVRPRGAGA